jgi:hypothetical protein
MLAFDSSGHDLAQASLRSLRKLGCVAAFMP